MESQERSQSQHTREPQLAQRQKTDGEHADAPETQLSRPGGPSERGDARSVRANVRVTGIVRHERA